MDFSCQHQNGEHTNNVKSRPVAFFTTPVCLTAARQNPTAMQLVLGNNHIYTSEEMCGQAGVR